MDSTWLERATRALCVRLQPAPLVVAAAAYPPTRVALVLEWPGGSRREQLVLDTDDDHPTLHLAAGARRADEAAPSPLADPLVGRKLTGVRPRSENRVLAFAFSAPALDPAAAGLELVVEWTGRWGNARLVDAGGLVLAALRRSGARAGQPYAPPVKPAGPVRATPIDSGRPAAPVGPDLPDDEVFEELRRRHEESLRRAAAERRRQGQLRAIRDEVRRLLRLRARLLEERGDPGRGARLRRSGEAILSHLHAIRRGDTELVVAGWGTDGGELRVTLDPARPAVESAEAYFRQARRWERGEPHRKRRLEAIDRAVARLAVLESRIGEAERPPGDEGFAARLAEALGLFRRSSAAPAGLGASPRAAAPARDRPGEAARRGVARTRRDASRRPRSFTTREGWTVLVGRSNEENDWLTHRHAHPEDYWFHAHGVPGSHVVLRREGRKHNPSARTLEEAASIAAFYSKARHSSKVPVIYTLRKHVRKPRGAKAGLAICEREKMILVRPKDPSEGREPEWMEE